MKPYTLHAILLIGYAIGCFLAVLLLAHPARAYAPADEVIKAPPPRPPMVCVIVSGQMKCEVK
jgi:hypothetical protein